MFISLISKITVKIFLINTSGKIYICKYTGTDTAMIKKSTMNSDSSEDNIDDDDGDRFLCEHQLILSVYDTWNMELLGSI